MLNHYLATALRNFRRHKVTTTINVLGLALGLTTFAITYGIATYNSRGDLYHEKSARTYVLTQRNEVVSTEVSVGSRPFAGFAVGPLLKTNFPALELVARATPVREVAVATSDTKLFASTSFVDAEFLEVFDFDFVSGDNRNALRGPRSAVIREELAAQIWGRVDVVGETLLLNNHERVNITGVVRAPREPSHMAGAALGSGLTFSLLVTMDTRAALWSYEQSTAFNDFMSVDAFTYLVMPTQPADYVDDVRAGLRNFGSQHVPASYGRAAFGLRPVSEIRQAVVDIVMRPDKTGLTSTAIMLLTGVMVLFVACLNYANLAAAHATTRTKELAMLRVVGATRRQIAVQSFIEALAMVTLAAVISLFALPLCAGMLRHSAGMDIRPVLFQSPTFMLVWLSVIVGTAALASLYPALVIARIRPAQSLQNGRATHTKRRTLRLLVIFQIAAASCLMVASSLIGTQNNVLRNFGANLQADPVVVILNDPNEIHVGVEQLKDLLRQQPAIRSVGGIFKPPGDGAQAEYRLVMNAADATSRHWLTFSPLVDDQFFATMDIPLLAGRNFSKDIASDSNPGWAWYGNLIIDRALAAQYGWTDPKDAVGKQIYLPTGPQMSAPGAPVTVVGVVENRTIYPQALLGSSSTVYRHSAEYSSSILVRIPKQQVEQGLRSINTVWNQLAPGVPLRQRFLDEQFEDTYRRISAFANVTALVGVFAMIVAAMGLLGIATHAITQRTFEIGVRRTLGASVSKVLAMLLKDFAKPVIIANLIAWPPALLMALVYRAQFTQQAPISLTPFVVSLMVGIGIAWLAVLRQSIKAARMNPATVLRHE